MEIIGLIIFVSLILYSLYDLHSEAKFTKKQKTNLSFMIILIPFGGSLIYFLIREQLLNNSN
jgi:hypothetical protein